ncbi:hypothetical protein E4U61_000426 [Claviceps capensis]|nr:hypothetical protein E4U61_000426 [Claviceps capensis]
MNKEVLEVMLGFLWMSEEDLGFDPTIQQIDGERFIKIERNERSECIVIDGLIMRTCCMVIVGNGGVIDDVRNCVRRRLDISTASKYQQGLSQDSSGATATVLPERRRTSTKRPIDQTGPALAPKQKNML